MSEWLDNPAIQGGVAPLVVALIIGVLFARTRFAWLAIIAGYATLMALSTGFSFSPLTAGRKILLIALLAPLVGLVFDQLVMKGHALAVGLGVAAGLLTLWVFASVLGQREGMALWGQGAGLVVFVAALVALMIGLRDDGLRVGAAGLGLGLATGVAALLSASIGFLLAGVALAASAGALLLVQVFGKRPIPAGVVGTLSVGLMSALFAAGTFMLAQLPWYALPLLLLVPLAVRLPVPESLPAILRAALLSLYALAAAGVPIAAAWLHTRGSS